jgi:hypothetical protein
MYLKSFNIAALLLAISWLLPCPLMAACYADIGCDETGCCGYEMAPDQCRAAAIKAVEAVIEFPAVSSIAPLSCEIVPAGRIFSLVVISDPTLAIESRIHPHTGPPLV